jgi:hypothetical protein
MLINNVTVQVKKRNLRAHGTFIQLLAQDKILYFLITVVGTWLFFLTVTVNASKFTSDGIEQLLRKNVNFLKLACTIQNKIQKLESNLL